MQNEGRLINHKQSPLFCNNKWSWMKTATLWGAGSHHEPLWLGGDHPLTHQCHYKSLARQDLELTQKYLENVPINHCLLSGYDLCLL